MKCIFILESRKIWILIRITEIVLFLNILFELFSLYSLLQPLRWFIQTILKFQQGSSCCKFCSANWKIWSKGMAFLGVSWLGYSSPMFRTYSRSSCTWRHHRRDCMWSTENEKMCSSLEIKSFSHYNYRVERPSG
jgi:hypothetical protein